MLTLHEFPALDQIVYMKHLGFSKQANKTCENTDETAETLGYETQESKTTTNADKPKLKLMLKFVKLKIFFFAIDQKHFLGSFVNWEVLFKFWIKFSLADKTRRDGTPSYLNVFKYQKYINKKHFKSRNSDSKLCVFHQRGKLNGLSV